MSDDMEVRLVDDNPHERSLRHHKIHGNGWIDLNDYRNVDNYRHPFIRAKNAPPHVWPINAADWGLEEWLPSQTDMTPSSGGNSHPVVRLDRHGEEKIGEDHGIVNAAFYYK